MKIIRLDVTQIIPFLLIVVLPTTLGYGVPDADVVEENQELAEGSTETTVAASQRSFLSPSHILEGIQNAYLPPALHMTGEVSTAPDPSPSEFWEAAKKSQKKLQNYAHQQLEAAGEYFESTRFTDITSAMNQIVSTTSTFRDNIKGALDAHHVTFEMLSEELETIFTGIASDLEKIPSPDKAPGHAERAEMVDNILDNTERELVKLAARYGIKEDVVTTYLHTLKPNIRVLTIAVGDINEQYPQLLSLLLFCITILIIPQYWILRPFLSLFGFGLAGPIRGSAAAWLQSYFFGAAVQSGSWFAWLQAAGMGVLPQWALFVTKVPLLVGGVLATLFNRG